jgi:thymidylate kinase
MTDVSGKLFVIEGLDGSGKTIQSGKLIARLREEMPDQKIMARDFPRYGHPSSYAVRKYLQREEFTKGYRRELRESPYSPSLVAWTRLTRLKERTART